MQGYKVRFRPHNSKTTGTGGTVREFLTINAGTQGTFGVFFDKNLLAGCLIQGVRVRKCRDTEYGCHINFGLYSNTKAPHLTA